MSRRTTYLLHFIDPETGQAARYRHAGHYIGDTEKGREEGRLEEHREGRGSVLTAAARRAGLDFVITRTWPGGALKARQLKTRSGALYCPECSEHPEPGTRPRRPGAKYLTRRQREAARRDREARERAASRPEFQEGWCWPGRPVAECPGCESRGRTAHTAECDERERAVARFLADIGAEPRKETGMAEPQGPLTGPELHEEIGRLAELYPEPGEGADYIRADYGRYAPDPIPEPAGVSPEAWDRYWAARPGSPGHRAAYGEMHRDVNGRGFPGPDPDQSYQADHGYESTYQSKEDLEGGFERADAWSPADDEPGPDAASWGPELDAPDHLYGTPECSEADPETEHFGWPQPEPEDAGRFPLPRVLADHEANPVLAPVAAGLPDGTPHADPFLAARGWQARGGLYARRAAVMEREAG